MKISKFVGMLTTMALLTNITTNSVVLANEEASTPEVEVLAPGAVENELVEVAEEASNRNDRVAETNHDPVVIAAFVEELKGLRSQLLNKQAAGWTSATEGATEYAIEYLDSLIFQYSNISANSLDSEELREEAKQAIIRFIDSLVPPAGEQPETPKPEAPKPGETPTPENPKPEAPKPGETPAPETPKPGAPKPGEEPKPEAPKSTLPNTGDAEATAKPKDMTMEKPVSTTSATQIDNKQLPQTGEADSFAIFSAATLTILAGVGMLAYGKREEV